MRIGQFAADNHTSIDTIRHYMDMALILPVKKGAQYDFDAQCQADFEDVCRFRDMGFPLGDIRKVLHYKRLGQLTAYDRQTAYQTIFQNRMDAISTEMEHLKLQQVQLERYLENLPDVALQSRQMGVPLDALHLLYCPVCRKSYQFSDGHVADKQLMEGVLICPCGECLTVRKGLLFGQGALAFDTDVENNDTFIDAYVENTDAAYLKKLVSGLKWSQSTLQFDALEKQLLLELGTGHGFFLRHFSSFFPANAVYVAVDYDPHHLLWLKRRLEQNPPACNVLFVCADFRQIPLADQSVDLLLDISGSSNYAFTQERFLLELVQPLLKETSLLHAYFILFQNFSVHSKIASPYRRLFRLDEIRRLITRLGYREIDSVTTDPISQGGPMEDYFVPGEQVFTLNYHGIRTAKTIG